MCTFRKRLRVYGQHVRIVFEHADVLPVHTGAVRTYTRRRLGRTHGHHTAHPTPPNMHHTFYTTQHNTTQHNTTQHNTTQHNTTQHRPRHTKAKKREEVMKEKRIIEKKKKRRRERLYEKRELKHVSKPKKSARRIIS